MKIISRGIFPLLFICMFIFSENKSVAQITIKSDQSETICAGTLVTYTATTTSCTSDIKQYVWKITDASNTVTSITRTTTKDTSIFITKAITNGAKISATVYWNNACSAVSGSLSAIVSTGNYSVISFKPTLTGSIAGKSTSVCEGTSNSYSVTPVSNATSYTWGLPNGWTGTSAVDSISAKASANSGTITVTANNACGSSNKFSLPVSVKILPAKPGPIDGPKWVCDEATATFSVTPVSGATSYSWNISFPSLMVPNSKLDTNIFTFRLKRSSLNDQFIYVYAANGCGNSLSSNLVFGMQRTPLIPNQTDTVCSGSVFKIIPADGNGAIVPTGTSYLSSEPSYSGNVGDVTGGTAQLNRGIIEDVLINHTNVFQTATYTVTPTLSGAGCVGNTYIQRVVVRPLPASPSAIIGKDTSCPGQTNTYSVATQVGISSYTWSLPDNWSGTSTTNSISATAATVIGNATLSVTANNSCSSLLTAKTVMVNLPVISTQTDTVCSGSTFTISPVNFNTTIVPIGTTYTWSKPNYTGNAGDVTGGTAQSNKSTINDLLINHTNVFQTATYTVTPKSGECAGKPFIQNVVVGILPAAPSVIIGNDTSCANIASTYSVTPQVGIGVSSYTWSLPSGWSGISTTNKISVTPSVNNGIITVTSNNLCGSSNQLSLLVSVKTKPAKPGPIFGPFEICSGKVITYSVTPVSGATSYDWAISERSLMVPISKLDSNVISFKVKSSIFLDEFLYFAAINECGNSGTSLMVSVGQTPVIPVQNDTVCSGSLFKFIPVNDSIITIVPSGTTYSWSKPTYTGNLGDITGGTSQNYKPEISDVLINHTSVLQTATYTVTATSSPCSDSGFIQKVVVRPSLTTPSAIAGKDTSCAGIANTYSVTPVNNATSYTWSLPKGWSGTSTTNSISAIATVTGVGTLTVTANNGCSSLPVTKAVNVIAIPAAPDTIYGPNPICLLSTITYSVTPAAGVPLYYWSGSRGWDLPPGTKVDTNFISVFTVASAGTTERIDIRAHNQCGESIYSRKITIKQTPIIYSQSTTICTGSTFTISPVSIDSTIVPTGTTYTWSKPSYIGNVGDVTGGTAQTNKTAISDVLINHTSAFQTATYTVTPTSGTCTGKQFIQNVVIRTLPAAPSAIIGKDTSCANLANTYSVTAQTGITSYTWSLPNGWSGTSTKNSISATTSSVTSIGTLSVTANNACSSLITTKAVKVIAEPARPDSVFGPNPICALSTHTYSVTPVQDVTSYLWPRFSFSWSGDSNTNSIDVLGKDNPGNDIDVLVIAVNQCGQSNMGGIHVIVNSIPVISSQSTTICSGSTFTVSPVNAGTTIVPDSTTYTWSKPVYTGKAGDVTGGTAKSNKTSINDILINHTDTIQTATYTVTPTSRTCAGAAFTTKVDIYPSPIITNKTVTICSGSTFTVSPVNGKGTLLFAGTTYSWGAPTVTGGITGFTAQAGQSNIVQTLNNPSNFIQTATYTVTPKAALTGNCDGQPFLIEVSVNPNIVLPAQSFTVCNAIPFSIDLSNGANALVPKGTKYSWLKPTYSGIEGNLTGGEVQSNSLTINGTLVNNTFVAQIATYIVTPQVNTCIGSPFIVNVTVDPNFVIKNMSGAVCSGSTISSIPVSNSTNFIPPGYRYSWGLPIVTGGIQGATAGSNQFSISQTLINPTIAIQTARYVVFPTSAKGCVGAPFIITDSILPRPLKPSVSDFSNEQNQQITTQFCGGSTNISFNVNDPIEGCTYLWTALPKDLVTVRKNLSPNTVISFGASSTTYPATISVQPVFPSNRGDCASVNVVSTYTLSVGALTVKDSQNVFVQQPGNLLVCSDMNADSYQWGYDSIADGKPYFINGQEGQTFFPVQRFLTKEENPKLNLSDYWFWVIPYHEKGSYICKSKIYYNGPYSKNNVLKFELASLNLNDNPTKGAFDLMVKGDFYGNVTILVSDMLGQVIQQSDFKKQNGIETYHFDFTNLSIGIYAIQVRNDDMDAPLSVKLMIVR